MQLQLCFLTEINSPLVFQHTAGMTHLRIISSMMLALIEELNYSPRWRGLPFQNP